MLKVINIFLSELNQTFDKLELQYKTGNAMIGAVKAFGRLLTYEETEQYRVK